MSMIINENKVGISQDELNAQIEIIKNQFQDKRITWNGVDNVLLTTALTELQQTASGKANIVVANELPQTTVANTQYWVQTYNGQTLQNGRYILITDSLNVVNYVGTSDVDLSEYVKNTRKVGNNNLGADITPANLFNDIKDLTGIFTNKTVDADNNTVSNIETDNFKADVVKEILSAICTNQQIPTAKAVWDAVYTAGMDYSTMTSLDDIFTTLNVPEKGTKCGYITNFTPAQTAGAAKAAGYIRASLSTASYKMLEFFPWSDGKRWWVIKNNGTWGDWTDGSKYMHILKRWNSDTKEYSMGYIMVINDKKTMTFADFKTWLKDNGYTSVKNTYHLVGGCCGTTGVRNKEDTGTVYIGKIVSGVYINTTSNTMYFKWDYNGTLEILEARCTVESIKLQQ